MLYFTDDLPDKHNLESTICNLNHLHEQERQFYANPESCVQEGKFNHDFNIFSFPVF